MARQARLVLAGQPHHVLQRGHNRQPVFMDDADRQAYLDALREATRLHGVLVHGYVLMPNHIHLLVTPHEADGLARAMQTLGRRYVAGFNRRHGRCGTLWEGRFRTTLIEAPLFYAAALQYIEQHPQRAGLVDTAADYAWSSAAHHLGQRRDPLIAEHAAHWALGNTPFERELRWRHALAEPLAPDLLSQLRRHVHGGWPLLSPARASQLAQQLDRPMSARPVGRPRLHSVPN
ncbi:putative transposase [Inhella inkyongensis]|uniref:Putative transposase n=1 Tax=Inhella inkyongensis TaxID=392593 RepID=A0A840S393_9BURK|nr:transposase [Inhella inkyongensis]MBB5203304.1 putative transposase [Inhella inkyongensis]